MEKDNFSTEQDTSDQFVETVEYPEFNPDKAKELQDIEAVKTAFWEQKENFLKNVETEISSGGLPEQVKDREKELWTTKIKVEKPEYFQRGDGGIADHLTDFIRNLDNGQIRLSHEITLPIDILDNSEYKHMISHELAHGLEGYSQEDGKFTTGFNRLFKGGESYLGTCLNEGMTEHIAERFSGEKINYDTNKEDAVVGYPNYYKFIKFLSSAGVVKVDMKYFVDAYCLSGDEGDKAIATLRGKLAEAFPTENGANALDNLAAHKKDQIEYWISTYTQAIS